MLIYSLSGFVGTSSLPVKNGSDMPIDITDKYLRERYVIRIINLEKKLKSTNIIAFIG